MWIGKDVAGRYHDHLEVNCEREYMIEDNVMT
jgi:hypothetical protein